MELKGTLNSRNNFERRENWTHISFPVPKLTLVKSYINKTCGIAIRTDIIDQWNRLESPEINPYIYGQLIFDRGAKDHSMGERIIPSTNGAVKTGYLHVKERGWTSISHCIQSNSIKWNKDLNLRAKIKILRRTQGHIFMTLNLAILS